MPNARKPLTTKGPKQKTKTTFTDRVCTNIDRKANPKAKGTCAKKGEKADCKQNHDCSWRYWRATARKCGCYPKNIKEVRKELKKYMDTVEYKKTVVSTEGNKRKRMGNTDLRAKHHEAWAKAHR